MRLRVRRAVSGFVGPDRLQRFEHMPGRDHGDRDVAHGRGVDLKALVPLIDRLGVRPLPAVVGQELGRDLPERLRFLGLGPLGSGGLLLSLLCRPTRIERISLGRDVQPAGRGQCAGADERHTVEPAQPHLFQLAFPAEQEHPAPPRRLAVL